METKKINRNDLCPCGSGKKYKKCCLNRKREAIISTNITKIYKDTYNILLKDEKDIEGIQQAGLLVVETLKLVESEIKYGITTDYINKMIHDFTLKNNAIPAPLGYKGYPKSSCISVNEVVCHGIPGDRIINEGDIVNVDITSILNGYYADASKTFIIGKHDENAAKTVQVSKNSLKIAKDMIKPGCTVGDIGWAIQRYAESNSCSVVRDYVGHGIGFDFHEQPQIPHFGRKGTGVELVEGMIFTVEPMINFGKKDIRVLPDRWTAVTKDGSLSAQFEQTLLVTKTGCESLTPYEL